MVRILLSRSSLIALALAGTRRSQSFVAPRFSASRSTSILRMTAKRVLVPIGDGSEEIETTCITDTLTRFGASVTVASVMPDLVCTMSRGIKVSLRLSRRHTKYTPLSPLF